LRFFFTILFFSFIQQIFAQANNRPVRDSVVYDIGGATRKGSPGAYLYFSGNTSDDGRITRGVADFNGDSTGGHGWKVLINWQEEFTLRTDTAITFYDKSGSRDTVDIYLFDKDNAPKWDTIVNTHLYTPTYHIVSCGTCAGLPVTTVLTSPAGRKVQFALVVIHRTNLFSGLWPDLHKINFFGTLTGNKDTIYNMAPWAMQTWVPRKIGDIVNNFNLQNQQDTLWSDTALVDYGMMRNFDSQQFEDNQNVAMGSQAIDMGGGGYTAYKYNKEMSQHGHYQFAAVFGNTAYFDAQQTARGYSTQKSWSTNTPTDNPQLPASYSRKGYYMHGLAWLGGTCSGCTGVRTYNGTPTPAMGYLKMLGTSNEPTLFAFAAAWKTPIMVAAESIGVYDSVKIGDPNVLVFVAGYEGYNYDDAKATIILQKLYLRSRNLKMDGIDFHTLTNLKTDSFPYIPTTNQQIGNYGVDVGYWDDWHKNNNYMNGMLREAGNPNLKVSITEDPYQKGKCKRYPIDAGETFSVSQIGVPTYRVNGSNLSRLESFAVAQLAKDFIVSASGLYQDYTYTAVDEIDSACVNSPDAIDGNNGLFTRPTSFSAPPLAYTAAFAKASRKRRLGNYVFSDTVSYNPHGLAVFKYKHFSNSDSLMFEYRWMDSTGTGTVNLTGLVNTAGTIVTPSFTSRTATESAGTITAGAISLSADPMPRAFIVYSPGGGGGGGGSIPSGGIRIRVRIKDQ
jgi:hypothetical protein